MNKKTKIIFTSLAALIVLGAGAATAYTAYTIVCVDPEAQMLRELKATQGENGPAREKIKGLPVLEKLEREMCARMNLSKKEQARIVEEKRRGHEEYLREQAKMISETPTTTPELPKAPNPFIGILDATRAPMPPFTFKHFLTQNYWGGEIEGEFLGVRSGASYENPLQGVLLVSDKSTGSVDAKFYPTPTATGPVKIVSEMNGVLTLESLAGEFEVYHEDTDTREKVKTPGGKVYYFNVRTKTFQPN